MRNTNLAHGSLYLLGAYIGYEVGDFTGPWILAVIAGFLSTALFGVLLQILVFRRMMGQELRQTMVTIGRSIWLPDLMLAVGTGHTFHVGPPGGLAGPPPRPFCKAIPTVALSALTFTM